MLALWGLKPAPGSFSLPQPAWFVLLVMSVGFSHPCEQHGHTSKTRKVPFCGVPQLEWGHLRTLPLGCIQGDAYAVSGWAVAPTSCPSNTPTLMLGVEKSPFALCFVASPRQCILHTCCGEECCGRNVSLCSRSSAPLGVGCAGNLCPQQGFDDLAGEKACSGAFCGEKTFCTKEGLRISCTSF